MKTQLWNAAGVLLSWRQLRRGKKAAQPGKMAGKGRRASSEAGVREGR